MRAVALVTYKEWSFIREMNSRGTTFILTTHDLEDVEQLARNIVIINHGEKVFDDSSEGDANGDNHYSYLSIQEGRMIG
jgi:ABC-type multidrug transport system ATPase subunit